MVSWFGPGGKSRPDHQDGLDGVDGSGYSGIGRNRIPSTSAAAAAAAAAAGEGGGGGKPGGGGVGQGYDPRAMRGPRESGMFGREGGAKILDPIMEEVQNSTFSLKILVSAGSSCVFHVGGAVDDATDPTAPEVPHWEYFMGDK